ESSGRTAEMLARKLSSPGYAAATASTPAGSGKTALPPFRATVASVEEPAASRKRTLPRGAPAAEAARTVAASMPPETGMLVLVGALATVRKTCAEAALEVESPGHEATMV